MGGIDLTHICGTESMIDAVRAAVVGSACTGLELDEGSGHKVRSSDVRSVGDTRKCFSDKRLCHLHAHSSPLLNNTYVRLLAVFLRVSSQHVHVCMFVRVLACQCVRVCMNVSV